MIHQILTGCGLIWIILVIISNFVYLKLINRVVKLLLPMTFVKTRKIHIGYVLKSTKIRILASRKNSENYTSDYLPISMHIHTHMLTPACPSTPVHTHLHMSMQNHTHPCIPKQIPHTLNIWPNAKKVEQHMKEKGRNKRPLIFISGLKNYPKIRNNMSPFCVCDGQISYLLSSNSTFNILDSFFSTVFKKLQKNYIILGAKAKVR